MTLISSLASLERRLNHTANKSSTEGQAEEAAFDRNLGLELMRSVFSALALLLSTNSANRQHFRDIGGRVHFLRFSLMIELTVFQAIPA